MQDRTGKELSSTEIAQKATNRIKNIWLDFWLFILNRLAYNMPFHFVRRFFYRISGMKMGKNSFIHMGARFYNPAGIKIGDGTIIGDHVFLDGRASLTIGNNVDIASQVLIYNSQHDIHSEGFDPIDEEVEIGDYVFIGPRVVVQPGVKIGRGAIVAAGAVVTKDIPEFEVWGGVPAKFIGKRDITNPQYRLGRARLFQ